MIVRRHWVVLAKPLAFLIGALVATMLALGWGATLVALGLFAFTVAMAFKAGIAYLDWRNDTFTITDTAIVKVKKPPLGITKEEFKTRVATINNTGFDVGTVMARVLGYGDVYVWTAADQPPLVMDKVPHPDTISAYIDKMIEQPAPSRQWRE